VFLRAACRFDAAWSPVVTRRIAAQVTLSGMGMHVYYYSIYNLLFIYIINNLSNDSTNGDFAAQRKQISTLELDNFSN
jgi:hypothetical protein